MPISNSAAPVFHPPVDFAAEGQALAAETSQWISDHWLQLLIAVGIAVVIVFALLAVQKGAQRLCREDDALVSWRTIIGRIAARTRFWFLVIVAARLVDGYADAPPLVDKTIAFLFTVGLTFQAALWARELVIGFVEHRAGAAENTGGALTSAMGIIRFLVTFALFSIALILVLGNLGVNVAGLVAGLGVGGIAIGLAAQGVFADLFAGISILFDRPFRVGENISYGSSAGTVVAIGMKTTRIRAYTGELIIISNKNLLDKEIMNVTGRDHIRLSFTLSVTYETPPDTLARIPAMLKEMGEAEKVNVARAGFDAFGASSLDFAFTIDIPGSDWSIAHPMRDRLLVTIMKRFAAEGVGLAYPTQTTYTAAPDGRLIMPYAETPGATGAQSAQP
ncbi:mechanosensitive ion channel family protein [Sphingomonas abietis]|uniref:Mechanosensitive ion channel family protein n=1 Tax=Sphingomonas abietis TaxID=3012344 RepID=A0ABY7NQH1_9SPHN|nr:mechanosensitive ion channel family protein [Sphingomonas abietis]WBO22184.1 mechanosensitive ion channel family protein [Sphingomonas abietis]